MASARVLRFNRTERWVHWVQAVTFLLLLGTGLAIGVAGLQGLIGNRATLREIHLISAFFFVFGPALVALAGDRWAIRQDKKAVEEWSGDDVRWLAHPTTQPNAYSPPPGRYNAGQKLNAIFTVYATLAFGVTGLIMWQNRRFPFALVSQANTIHTWLAYIALFIFLGHLYLSVIHPATRAAFSGIIFGTVDSTWAKSHHPAWSDPPASEPALTLANSLRALSLLAIGLMAALLVTRFGLEWLGANVTDQVTKLIYKFSGFPGTLQNPATGVHSFDLGALIWLGLVVAIWYGAMRNRSLLPRVFAAPAKG